MVFAREANAALRRAGVDVEDFYLASRTAPAQVVREWWRLRHRIREQAARIVHAHPTLSEALHEAALGVDKRTINL